MAKPRDYDIPFMPTPDLMAHAKDLLQHLDGEDGARFVLWDTEAGDPIELDEGLFDLMRRILIDVSQNRAIQILPHAMELTTVQAAEFLQVSRPHLINQINLGRLKCRMVGTHRRIKLQDLIEYGAKVSSDSKAAREELTSLAEDLKLGC